MGGNDPFCSDTVVRFSPDGTHLYFMYLDIADDASNDYLDVQVRDGFSTSDVISTARLYEAGAGNLIDKEWLDVHTWDAGGGAAYVYHTYTYFTVAGGCSIVFNSSTDYGATWTNNGSFADGNCVSSNPLATRLLQGSRPVGGPGKQVLVCWYDSGTDGWSTGQGIPAPPAPVPLLNKFNIACRSSSDRGVTFAGGVAPPETTPGNWIYAAKSVGFELPYYLGPDLKYFRYSGAQFPSMTIDHLGNAHVVFTKSATAVRLASDCGNIGYAKSTGAATVPPYATWPAASTVASGAGAQFFGTVTSQKVNESAKPYIYVGWLDGARSVPFGASMINSIYDAKYRLSTTGGPAFGAPVLVTDHASVTDYGFAGDYIDSSANQGAYHIVWTDNRYAANLFAPREHFFEDHY